MIYFSLLLGKKVLDKDNANIVGCIKNAYFSKDCKTIAYFVASANADKKDMLVPFKEILCFNDALIVQNTINFARENDIDFTSFVGNLWDMPVYTQNGILKGTVNEIELSQGGKVCEISTQTTSFTPSAILSCGNAILLKSGVKTAKTQAVKMPRPKTERPVSIQSNNAHIVSDASAQTKLSADDIDHLIGQTRESTPQPLLEKAVSVQSAPRAIRLAQDTPYFSQGAFEAILGEEGKYLDGDDARTPSRIISDYSFLLGRTLTKDLFSYVNAPIARAGDIVTDEIVRTARSLGKLIDLTLSCV